MPVNKLRLTRNQLAKIIGNDQEAIKQFEKLFEVADAMEASGFDAAGLVASSAAAFQALGEISRLKNAVEYLQSQPNVRGEIKRLKQAVEALESRIPTHSPRKPAVDYIDFHGAGPHVAQDKRVAWNSTYDTMEINHGGNVTQWVGYVSYTLFPNTTGGTITKGTVLSLGYSGGATTADVVKFVADGSFPQLNVLGIAAEDVANGASGKITVRGNLRDLDTSAWSVGDLLYPSPSTPGALQNTKPTSPNACVPIAIVLASHATNGVLGVRPTIEQQEWHGDFCDTTTQTLAANYTPQAVTFNTTNFAHGFSITSGSRVTAEVSGLYDVQFSLQLDASGGATRTVYIYGRKNGADIPNSMSFVTITDGTSIVVPAWNFVVSLDAGDYFELIWASDSSSNVQLTAQAAAVGANGTAAFARPATPSAILTITQVAQ